MDHPRLEFYKDSAGEYRWRIRARNNRIICASSEGFTTKSDCKRSYDTVVQYLLDTVLAVHYDPSWKE